MTRTTLGRTGAAWAIAYVPIHVWWALGGSIAVFGIDDPGPDWELANWAACVLIAGAGILCLSLTERWGDALPLGLRRRTAQAAGLLAAVHWLLFTVTVAVSGPDRWGWWNLLVFEPWFGIMGVLLLACAGAARPTSTTASRTATTVTVLGVVTTVVGVVAFTPWLFAVVGPAVLAIGIALLARTRTSAAAADTAAGRTVSV